jgi:glycosyltransferase involved in cell wall biosynthesis
LNFQPVAAPELNMYIDKSLFKYVKLLYQRIDLSTFKPFFPDPANNRPLLVHMPSATGAKGTVYVEQAIERLSKHFDFEYIRVHNVKRSEALELVAKADIVLDQFIGGGYGMAACEAMAMGKPVLCYIMKELFDYGLTEDCPIINANPETLYHVLKPLLIDGTRRYNIGVESRKFVETYHDSNKLALELVEIYKTQLSVNKN